MIESEEQFMVKNLKAEADFLESQVKKYQSQEKRILDILNMVYHKREKTLGLQDNDLRLMNKEIREILMAKTVIRQY